METVMDWIIDNLGWFLLVFFVIAGISLCAGIYLDAHDPHISLNKTEWHCSHTHTVLIPVTTGKAIVLVPEQICDTYRMNGYEGSN
jgi:hypothetical protein